MKLFMIKKLILASFTLITACFMSGSLLASGSMPSPTPTPTASSLPNNYDRGKNIYMEKISCNSCPVPGGVSNAAGASELIARIDAGEFTLRSPEKRHLKAFLKRRFEIK